MIFKIFITNGTAMKNSVFALLMYVLLFSSSAAGADEHHKFLVGTWQIGTDSGARADKVGVMSIQPDGTFSFSVTDRLSKKQTVKNLTRDEAAQYFWSSLTVAGIYDITPGEITSASRLSVHIVDANDPALIGKDIQFQMKVHSPARIALGIVEMPSSSLNNIWIKLSPPK